MRHAYKSAGFTLIEMAIVLVIIGLVATTGMTTVAPVLDARKAVTTASRMDLIEKALQLHVIRYSCLPCPADGSLADATANAGHANDGSFYITKCATGACITANAVVPWWNLGLSSNDVIDGWGNRIRYAATPALALTDSMLRTTTFPTGDLNIEETYSGCVNPPACTTTGDVRASSGTILGTDAVAAETTGAIYGKMAYVLVSSGPDRALAIPANGCPAAGCPTNDRYSQSGTGRRQDLNANGGTTFALNSPPITAAGAAHFDDIVRYITAPLLVLRCGTNACGNPF